MLLFAAPGQEAELWNIVKPGLDQVYPATTTSSQEETGQKVSLALYWGEQLLTDLIISG